MQRPRQRRLTIPPTRHKLPPQRPQTRTPPNRQSPAQLLLHLPNLLHQLSIPTHTTTDTAGALALCDGIHGGGEEETNGFIDVRFVGDRGQSEFGEGFGDADDGLELAHSDGDGGADVGGFFGLRHAVADRDEMGGELFGGGGGEARGAPSVGFG